MSTISVPFHRLAINTDTVELVGYATGKGAVSVTISAGAWTGLAPVDNWGRFLAQVPVSVGENTIQATVTDEDGQTAKWIGTVVRLITNRAQSDLTFLKDQLAAPIEDWTEAELAGFNLALSRGAYNYTDLNRVSLAANLVYQSLVDQGFVVNYDPVTHDRAQYGRVPKGYAELEYIQSNGNQYINTNFNPNQNTRVICKFEFTNNSGLHQVIFGARTSQSEGQYVFGFAAHNSPQTYRSDYGTTQSRFPNISFSGIHTVDKNKNICTVDGETETVTSQAFQTNCSICIFANNTAGSLDNFISAKIFEFLVYDNELLVIDFIPCKNPNGIIGFYNTVDSKFYQNLGSGEFIAGPEIIYPEPLNPYIWYEEDNPTQTKMTQYLANAANLLEVRLVQQLVTLPKDTVNLTLDGANNIELALAAVDAVTMIALKSYIYSGEAYAGEF